MPPGLGLTLLYGALALVVCGASLLLCLRRGWGHCDFHQSLILNALLFLTWAAAASAHYLLPGVARVLPLALVDLLCVAVVMLLWSGDEPPRRTWKLALANTYVLHCVLYAAQTLTGGLGSHEVRYGYDLSHNIVFLMQVALGGWPAAHAGVEALVGSHRGRRRGVAPRGAAAR